MESALDESGEVSRCCQKERVSYCQATGLTINLDTWNKGDANSYCFSISWDIIRIIAKTGRVSK